VAGERSSVRRHQRVLRDSMNVADETGAPARFRGVHLSSAALHRIYRAIL
jgi:hypothetical protein